VHVFRKQFDADEREIIIVWQDQVTFGGGGTQKWGRVCQNGCQSKVKCNSWMDVWMDGECYIMLLVSELVARHYK